MQDRLTGALIGLAKAYQGNEDVANEQTDKLMIEGLFTTITNVSFNNDTIQDVIDRVHAENCFLPVALLL